MKFSRSGKCSRQFVIMKLFVKGVVGSKHFDDRLELF